MTILNFHDTYDAVRGACAPREAMLESSLEASLLMLAARTRADPSFTPR